MNRHEQLDLEVYGCVDDYWAREWTNTIGRWNDRKRRVVMWVITFDEVRAVARRYEWARYRVAKFRFALGLEANEPDRPDPHPPPLPTDGEKDFTARIQKQLAKKIDDEIGPIGLSEEPS